MKHGRALLTSCHPAAVTVTVSLEEPTTTNTNTISSSPPNPMVATSASAPPSYRHSLLPTCQIRRLAPLLFLVLFLCRATSDPDDESCLNNLYHSLSDPTNSLKNWTKSTFSSPCNGFTSYLQGATCNNGRVYKLSLPGLSLSGTLTPFLSNCTNLQTLDLSSNSISGPIPPDLSSLLNLAVLNLSNNQLSGPIPPQLASCAYLNVIDLHSNQLSGPIPDQLGLLARLTSFDVSYNRLEGPVPILLANMTGMGLPRFNASSFVGNKDLFGYPLGSIRGRSLSVLAIVGIGLASGLISLVLSFTAVCVWLRITEEKGATVTGEEGKVSQLMPEY